MFRIQKVLIFCKKVSQCLNFWPNSYKTTLSDLMKILDSPCSNSDLYSRTATFWAISIIRPCSPCSNFNNCFRIIWNLNALIIYVWVCRIVVNAWNDYHAWCVKSIHFLREFVHENLIFNPIRAITLNFLSIMREYVIGGLRNVQGDPKLCLPLQGRK